MWKQTDSLIKHANLLDYVDMLDDEDEDVLTFGEFKNWVNSYDFKQH